MNILSISEPFSRYIKLNRGLIPADTDWDAISIADVDIDLIRSVTINDVYEYMNYIKNERGNCNKTRARKTTSRVSFFVI